MRLLPVLCLGLLASGISAQIPLPGYTSTFASGNATRGFYFQTPVPIVITGLRVPDERGAGVQCVEVFRMAAPPPVFSQSATGGSVFYANNIPSAQVIPCNLVFLPGEYVGVLGACGTTTMNNSYGTANFQSNVLGQPITLTRFLTQTNLHSSGGNQPYSTEPNGAISRIEVYVAGQSAAIDYGTGSGGGGPTVPSLRSNPQALGTTAVLALSQSAATNQGGALALAIGRNNLPLFGGTLWINPPIVTITFPGALQVGTNTISLPIPNDPTLMGGPAWNWQGITVAAPSVGLSNGLEWVLGA